MSVTGHNDVRRPDDAYMTPPWCVLAVFRSGLILDADEVFDPCAGEGSILDAARREGFATSGFEIDAGRGATALSRGYAVVQRDALTPPRWGVGSEAVVVMNPPFSLAMDFVQRALLECPRVVALLRLPWLASQGRAAWLRANTPTVCVLPKRPSFTGTGKTDATDYAWMFWGFGPPTVKILEVPQEKTQ